MQEVKECLHCGEGIPFYCEECYQQLIAENSRLQLQLREQKEQYEEVIDSLINS